MNSTPPPEFSQSERLTSVFSCSSMILLHGFRYAPTDSASLPNSSCANCSDWSQLCARLRLGSAFALVTRLPKFAFEPHVMQPFTRNSLSYATLLADSRGVVTATLIDPGQVVASGQTAIRVARFAEKEAVVAIPETLVGRAKSGTATVTLWSDADKKYTAKLREIAPSADPATRTYLAKFSLPEADDKVSLGMTATLTLADAATERVAKLPLSALFSQGSNPSLYTVDDAGAVKLQPVIVKSYESNAVVIAAGVNEGAKVVALGVQKIDPAQKVRVVSALSF